MGPGAGVTTAAAVTGLAGGGATTRPKLELEGARPEAGGRGSAAVAAASPAAAVAADSAISATAAFFAAAASAAAQGQAHVARQVIEPHFEPSYLES
jgi:hypothetical protein